MEVSKQSHNPLLISEDAQPGHRAARGEGRDLSGHQRTQTPTNSRKSRHRNRDREAARLVLAAADSEI